MDILKRVTEKMRDYPLYYQEETEVKDKVIICKLFNAFWAGTWYLTEYDPDTQIAFWYASIWWDYNDEWGYINLNELASLKKGQIQLIEIDIFFAPGKVSEIIPEYM